MFTAMVVVALGLATFGTWQNHQRTASLCAYAKRSQQASIADAREQAEVLFNVAANQAEKAGHPAEAKRLREVTGPPFVTAQVEAARRRHPPINCSDL
jgi:hypothetical protein